MSMGCCNGGYHEFNLDWFISRFKEVEGEWDGTKSWLKNWIDTLNVSSEVKKILDGWLEDGTIEDIITEKVFKSVDVESLNKKLVKGGLDIVFIGDSICNGWGWWNTNVDMTDENRGVYSIMKKNYPNNTYHIYARNSAFLSSNMDSSNNIYSQLLQVESTADIVFVLCGINDINGVFQNRNQNGDDFGFDVSFFAPYIHDDWSTTLSSLCSTITFLKNKSPKCDVYYIVPPTTLSNNQMFYGAFQNLIFTAQQYGYQIINGQSIVKNIKMPYNNLYLYDAIHPNKKGYEELYSLIMQSDFQKNQIIYSDGIIRTISGDLMSASDVEDMINKCVSFVKTKISSFKKEYYNNDYVFNLDNEIAIVHIEHSYNNNYYFTFSFPEANGIKIRVMFHEVTGNTYFLDVTNYNTNMAVNIVPSKLDDITTSGDYMLSPQSEKLADKGFNPAPFVQVKASVCYFDSGEQNYVMQKMFIITQRDCDFMLIYNYVNTDTVKESFLKITGTKL